MTIQQAAGVRLLALEAAAEHAGVSLEAVRNWAALGLVEPRPTPLGPRYAMHEIDDVLAGRSLLLAPRLPPLLSPREAARILRVDTRTLWQWARRGDLTRVTASGHGGWGRYRRDEVLALRDKREAVAKS